MARMEGAFQVEDFFNNSDGLNTSDSPFVVGHNTAADGVNYEYVSEGAIQRRKGHTRLGSPNTYAQTVTITNSSPSPAVFTVSEYFHNYNGQSVTFTTTGALPDGLTVGTTYYVIEWGTDGANKFRVSTSVGGSAVVTTSAGSGTHTATILERPYGLGLWDKPGTSREVILAAGSSLLKYSQSVYTSTSLTDDSASALTSSVGTRTSSPSTTPVTSSMFNTANAGILWHAGAGSNNLYGVYSASKFTPNGVVAPTIGTPATFSISNTSSTWVVGLYAKYMVSFIKGSTGAEGNAAVIGKTGAATIANDQVNVTFGAGILTPPEATATRYTKMRVYRTVAFSSFTNNNAFTGGDLIAELDITGLTDTQVNAITLTDLGNTVTVVGATNSITGATASLVPNAGFTVLDNSVLPSGTYNVVTTWKRCLVTASNNTVYISDTNKPESWPLSLRFNIPSGGSIQAIAVVSASSVTSASIDEYLLIFKQNEVYLLQGSPDPTDTSGLSLNFLDSVGCVGPAAVVYAEGNAFWVSARGIYAWNGNGKPVSVSRPIKDKFFSTGDVDQTKALETWGYYKPNTQHIIFTTSSLTRGANKLVFKLDLKKLNRGTQDLTGKSSADGIITQEVLPSQGYAGIAFFSSASSTTQTYFYVDSAGYVWSKYLSLIDQTSAGVNLQVPPFSYTTQHLHLNTPFVNKKIHKVLVYFRNYGPVVMTCNLWSKFKNQASQATPLVFSSDISGSIPLSSLYGAATYGPTGDGIYAAQGVSPKIELMTFNANNHDGNDLGDSFRLQFSNTDSIQPIEIVGFSIYYTTATMRNN